MEIIRNVLTRQATYLRPLEATNARLTSGVSQLRERKDHIDVLRERGLESQVAALEEMREYVAQSEPKPHFARASSPSTLPSSFAMHNVFLTPIPP